MANTLSIEAFSTLRIFPLIGIIACVFLFLALLAEPPAESPSTIKISHSSGFLLSQFESLPLLSIENLLFERRFVFVLSSAFLIFADFSAQLITFFNVSKFLSKNNVSCSPAIDFVTFSASGLSSLVFVCPSNLGSGCFTATTATRPFLTSAPVKLLSFSFNIPSSLAY